MRIIEQLNYRPPQSWRPHPTVIEEAPLGLLGVCFSWGEVNLADKLTDNIRFFVDAHLNQSEITNPFGYEESLSGLENALRSGGLLANDVIYRLVNKSNLSAGAECVIAVTHGRELALMQVGQPQVFLKRKAQIFPLLTTFDFIPATPASGAFIPSKLLGTNNSCYPRLQSLRYEPGDELIFLAHSCVPKTLMETSSAATSLHDLFQCIVKELPNCPFWISKVQL